MASEARRGVEDERRPSKQLSIAASKLTKTERERMKRRFERFAGRTPPGDKLSIEDFVSVPELSGNPLMLRVFQILDTDGAFVSLLLQMYIMKICLSYIYVYSHQRE